MRRFFLPTPSRSIPSRLTFPSISDLFSIPGLHHSSPSSIGLAVAFGPGRRTVADHSPPLFTANIKIIFQIQLFMDGERGSVTGKLGSIDLSERKSVVDLTGQIHQLPCCIKYDGPCSVCDYFKPKDTGIEVDGQRVKEAYFRGRKLQGTTIPLPHGYSGFIIGKKSSAKRKSSDTCEGKTDCWQMSASFQNITFWNHDSLPSADDVALRSLHWFDVAKALHQPVTAEDMASTSKPGFTVMD